MIFERGFKSWAERTAVSLRSDLQLDPHSPLSPHELADYLDVELRTPNQIAGLKQSVIDQLLRHDPSGWSAVGIYRKKRSLIIYNPTHSHGRQSSDIMHELAHLILDHNPAVVVLSHDGKVGMRSYNQDQEDQANWLGWCLLLPRPALIHCTREGLSVTEIAEAHCVTQTLARFRLRVTGVDAQNRALRRLRRS